MTTFKVKDLPFQTKAVEDIIKAIDINPQARVALIAPTGSGKTIICRRFIASPYLHEVLLKNKTRKTVRIIFKCHMERLLTQARRRFDANICGESTLEQWRNEDAGLPFTSPGTKVEICYQMLGVKLEDNDDIDLIVYDEYHHEACNTVQEFLSNAGKFPSLGMTASPERGDNCLIKFDVMVEPLTRQEAVSQGYICETDINTIVDSSSQNKVHLLKKVLVAFNHEMKQTMIFVRTRKEIKEVVEFINSTIGEGLSQGCDEGDDLDFILDSFGNQEFKYIVSCKKLGEGVDISGVTDVVFAKNIGSAIDLNQYIGRAARVDIPECRVWEFVNPFSTNLDTVDVVGIPKSHRLINLKGNEFVVRDFM